MKKLTRRSIRFKGLTVGLDVHKTFIQYVVFDRCGDEECGGRIDSSPEGFSGLLQIIDGRDCQFVLEACGSFLWVFNLLSKQVGRERVHVAQPHRVRPIANSYEKNDENDAWWLGYLCFEGRLPEAWVPDKEILELRIATRELRSVVDRRSDLIRRFKSHLQQEGLRIRSKNFHSQGARQQAEEFIASRLGARSWALEQVLRQIEFLDEVIQWWEAKVQELCQGLPEVKTMRKEMPGIGPATAAILVAELGSPSRYNNQKAYAKATGLTPGFRESGGRRISVGMSRAGSKYARWALTRAVIACMRCKRGAGVSVRHWVLRRTKHRPKKVVYVAAARKLAEGIWRLFSLGEEFDLQRAFPGGRPKEMAA